MNQVLTFLTGISLGAFVGAILQWKILQDEIFKCYEKEEELRDVIYTLSHKPNPSEVK